MKKRSEKFVKLPFNLGRRSFLDISWPFDEKSDVFDPINGLHVVDFMCRRIVNRKEWADKLDDALWAFRTAYESPTGSTPFRIVYGKAYHLPIKIEHKAYWALKNVNLDLDTTRKH
ncbi:reverse transcriptase domain-containing protein, partial [Tanacetum coccineum]